MNGIEQITKKVKNHGCAPVIALSSDERALIDDALDIVRNAYLSEASADLNHHKFFVLDNDASDLMTAVLTTPFLTTHRVVEVHNAEKLDAALNTALIEYCEKPCASTVLVLIFHRADKRNKLLAELQKRGYHIALAVETLADRRSFLFDEAKAHGINLAPQAADLLLSMVDRDLLLLKNAVEKLALISKEITVEHVEQHIVANCEHDVFHLARKICEGHLAESLIGLGLLRNSDENAIKFLGVLMWQLRVLTHIRSCLDQGMTDWDIRKEVNVFGDRFSWMVHIAKKRNLEFHIERLTKLTECDKSLKTSATIEPFHVLERFVYQSAVGL